MFFNCCNSSVLHTYVKQTRIVYKAHIIKNVFIYHLQLSMYRLLIFILYFISQTLSKLYEFLSSGKC